MRISRFAVAEESMAPTLLPGDYLIAVTKAKIESGDLVVFEHPQRPGFWLVKRAVRVDRSKAYVYSDNAGITRADSRSFGSIPVGRLQRVIACYWPLHRIRFFRR